MSHPIEGNRPPQESFPQAGHDIGNNKSSRRATVLKEEQYSRINPIAWIATALKTAAYALLLPLTFLFEVIYAIVRPTVISTPPMRTGSHSDSGSDAAASPDFSGRRMGVPTELHAPKPIASTTTTPPTQPPTPAEPEPSAYLPPRVSEGTIHDDLREDSQLPSSPPRSKAVLLEQDLRLSLVDAVAHTVLTTVAAPLTLHPAPAPNQGRTYPSPFAQQTPQPAQPEVQPNTAEVVMTQDCSFTQDPSKEPHVAVTIQTHEIISRKIFGSSNEAGAHKLEVSRYLQETQPADVMVSGTEKMFTPQVYEHLPNELPLSSTLQEHPAAVFATIETQDDETQDDKRLDLSSTLSHGEEDSEFPASLIGGTSTSTVSYVDSKPTVATKMDTSIPENALLEFLAGETDYPFDTSFPLTFLSNDKPFSITTQEQWNTVLLQIFINLRIEPQFITIGNRDEVPTPEQKEQARFLMSQFLTSQNTQIRYLSSNSFIVEYRSSPFQWAKAELDPSKRMWTSSPHTTYTTMPKITQDLQFPWKILVQEGDKPKGDAYTLTEASQVLAMANFIVEKLFTERQYFCILTDPDHGEDNHVCDQKMAAVFTKAFQSAFISSGYLTTELLSLNRLFIQPQALIVKDDKTKYSIDALSVIRRVRSASSDRRSSWKGIQIDQNGSFSEGSFIGSSLSVGHIIENNKIIYKRPTCLMRFDNPSNGESYYVAEISREFDGGAMIVRKIDDDLYEVSENRHRVMDRLIEMLANSILVADEDSSLSKSLTIGLTHFLYLPNTLSDLLSHMRAGSQTIVKLQQIQRPDHLKSLLEALVSAGAHLDARAQCDGCSLLSLGLRESVADEEILKLVCFIDPTLSTRKDNDGMTAYTSLLLEKNFDGARKLLEALGTTLSAEERLFSAITLLITPPDILPSTAISPDQPTWEEEDKQLEAVINDVKRLDTKDKQSAGTVYRLSNSYFIPELINVCRQQMSQTRAANDLNSSSDVAVSLVSTESKGGGSSELDDLKPVATRASWSIPLDFLPHITNNMNADVVSHLDALDIHQSFTQFFRQMRQDGLLMTRKEFNSHLANSTFDYEEEKNGIDNIFGWNFLRNKIREAGAQMSRIQVLNKYIVIPDDSTSLRLKYDKTLGLVGLDGWTVYRENIPITTGRSCPSQELLKQIYHLYDQTNYQAVSKEDIDWQCDLSDSMIPQNDFLYIKNTERTSFSKPQPHRANHLANIIRTLWGPLSFNLTLDLHQWMVDFITKNPPTSSQKRTQIDQYRNVLMSSGCFYTEYPISVADLLSVK